MYSLHVNGTGFPSASPGVTKKNLFLFYPKGVTFIKQSTNTKLALF